MYPWEYAYAQSKWAAQRDTDPQEALSPEELTKLRQVRARFGGHPAWMELALDERRLSFVRWLVDHGRINEEGM
jgi:hypothetical protein